MANRYRPAPRTQARAGASLVFLIVMLAMSITGTIAGVMLLSNWPAITARFGGNAALPLPTAAVPRLPTLPAAQPIGAQTVPTASLMQTEATSQAIYQATVQAVEAVPNVNTTGDSAPVIVESKPAERMPAGDNVPTAEPVAQPESGSLFGSKPVVVAPQETHECRHGQAWTDSGCKNPTPIGAP
jgi:hypothetical protein